MSGYLEVKYPLKPNLGLNPFKSWKRQWCILRPSPTRAGGSLAVYCSEAGATAGSIELPSGGIVRRTKSRTRPYAFAVFPIDDRKARVLLAAQSLLEAQSWMDKIKALLNGDKLFGTETLLKDTFPVTIIPTELSQKLGLQGDSTLTISATGVQLARQLATVITWQYVKDVVMVTEDNDRICVLAVDSDYSHGGGELKLSTPAASEVYTAVSTRQLRPAAKKLSKSDSHLPTADIEVRRTSWYSGPSEVSLDDIDLVMSKLPVGQLSRCSGAGELSQEPQGAPRAALQTHSAPEPSTFDDSMSDRRSLLSVASGIYEEIPDLPDSGKEHSTYCKMGRDLTDGLLKNVEVAIRLEEPTYESVADCVYATMRRGKRYPPPPLPPRLPFGTTKLGSSWNSRMNSADGSGVTRHSSLGSLPRCCSVSSARSRTDPANNTTQHKTRSFSVFRKRLKSDSRITSSPKSDTSKENKDIETKKKKFDFTPTRDIFKNFKVSRKMKSLKIGALNKGETKSCEFLDETEHVTTNRCSKSVECLEDKTEFLDEFEGDLSIEFNDDAVAALALPQEIVDLILRSREQVNKIRLKHESESDYMPMSPIVPAPPVEHHYIVMSPKTNIA